jgi:RND family efflux transporter MFP subunit
LTVVLAVLPALGVPTVSAQEFVWEPSELDCLIRPRSRIEVASPVEGVIESVEVGRGDLVEVGQVLARLESSVEQAAVAAAQARVEMSAQLRRGQVRAEFAQRSLDRSAELQRRAAISLREFDEAETESRLAEVEIQEAREANRLAKLELRRARAVLARRTIRSPVEGVVVERILSPGEYADPPQVLEIAEIDPLHVEVFAPLSMLGTIEKGQTGQVFPEGPAGGPHEATVTVVDRVVDAASGTFGVRLELPNPDHRIPAGLKCRVRFGTGRGPAR